MIQIRELVSARTPSGRRTIKRPSDLVCVEVWKDGDGPRFGGPNLRAYALRCEPVEDVLSRVQAL